MFARTRRSRAHPALSRGPTAGGPRPRKQRGRTEGAIALNYDRNGHVYPAYTYEITRPKVCEYALATGSTDPVYTADPSEIPPEQVPVPPTFAACFSGAAAPLLIGDPELGAHWNLVHGAQEYDFTRALRVGDWLRCTPQIADMRDRGRMDILTMRVECVERDTGAPVVRSQSTIIFFKEGG
ncbi:hypothetical protein ER308_13270 [Egibacter rhizosphaerae]|uniref:FAS1-like dehydratase domain-containing protein n=1 Tax=Egibacter rhizosphaerae TaxID=1670831 RepID=A0A411YGT2_9ACTN|nr:MaoC family dehydratase N-terminal domain-containing protein [Egibacter rhizosphaerae]QBI20438.1 hypothetical protein ER308_13270 [Egibacter rhizosphaerae]